MQEELTLAQQQLAEVVEANRLLEEAQLRAGERIAELEKETSQLFDQVTALQTHYEERDLERTELLRQLEERKQEPTPDTDAIESSATQEALEGAQRQNFELQSERESFGDRVTALEAERAELLNRVEIAEQAAQQSQHALEDVKAQVADGAATIEKLTAERGIATSVHADFEREAGHLRSQLQESEKRIIETENQLKTMIDARDILSVEVKDLKEKSAETRSDIVAH